MRPYPEEVLRAIQNGIQGHLAPEVKSSYGQSQFAFSMLLFMIVQRDYDTAVPDLIEANKALRELLAEADAALGSIDRDDTRRGREAIASIAPPAESLRLSALRSENDSLRGCIGALAPLIEPAADTDGLAPLRPVRERIYAWLAADARKRIVPILSAG